MAPKVAGRRIFRENPKRKALADSNNAYALPIVLTAAHIVTDRVPDFNIQPSCRAVAPNSDADACKREELTAHDKFNDQWKQFMPAQRAYCVSLTELGGSPSYVDLLTCLELAKAAKRLPPGDRTTGQDASD